MVYSEINAINDGGMGSRASESGLCSNGCGFFGSAATMGLCSKCYRDLRIQEARKIAARVAGTESTVSGVSDSGAEPSRSAAECEEPPVVMNRCSSCNKKVGFLGFQCKCGGTFCGAHRYAEKHGCTFDYKGAGRESISLANPVIKKDKMDRI